MSSFQHATCKIAAWNLSGYHPIPPERLERQIEGLATLDAEVIALVEVNPLTALDTFKQGLHDLGVDYNSVHLEQPRNLNLAVLYKQGVVAGDPEPIEGSNAGDVNARKAMVVNMKVGKFDFDLIVVHLKSGRDKPEQEKRDQQAKVIGEYIKAKISAGREDILLVGDFNMIPGQDVSNFHHLGGDDLMDFLSSWDLQARFSHILDKGRANLLDGFAIRRTYSKEYVRGSLRLFPMHWTMDIGRDEYRDTVSDHLPFVATFRIDKDRY
jgi:endonuclease/exonuclease/phosphatase family metal-dependent hydrolase